VTLRLQIGRATKTGRIRLVTLLTKTKTIKKGRTATIVLRRAAIKRNYPRLRLSFTTRTNAGSVTTAARVPKR
jgi:hypothetical protein